MRYPLIDILRGLAVVTMIIYHIGFDLSQKGLGFFVILLKRFSLV